MSGKSGLWGPNRREHRVPGVRLGRRPGAIAGSLLAHGLIYARQRHALAASTVGVANHSTWPTTSLTPHGHAPLQPGDWSCLAGLVVWQTLLNDVPVSAEVVLPAV